MELLKLIFFDVEVFNDYFLGVFISKENNKEVIIQLHKNQKQEETDYNINLFLKLCDKLFVKYIRNAEKHIIKNINDIDYVTVGFNNYNYDLPIIMFLYLYLKNIENKDVNKILDALNEYNTFVIGNNKVYDIINLSEKARNKRFKKINPDVFIKIVNKLTEDIRIIPTLDIYKINGWDNEQRSASLKWLSANTNADIIVESKYDFNQPLLTDNEEENKIRISETIRYCVNDVKETMKIYNITETDIKDRIDIWKKWIEQYSCDGRIEKQVFGEINRALKTNRTQFGVLTLYQEITDFNISKIFEIKRKRKELYSGDLESLKLEDIILKKIKLKDVKSFEDIKNTIVCVSTARTKNTKEGEEIDTNGYKKEYTIKTNAPEHEDYSNTITCSLGLGGIHGCNSGIYVKDDKYCIITFDVISYYPSNVIANKWYPKPLGKEFVKVYSGIKEKRLKYPKGTSLNRVYKDCLNSIIGESKSRTSDIFDYEFFYSITVNGQLILINLIEELADKYTVYPVMVNTDGGEIVVEKKDKDSILKDIEEFGNRFNLTFETDEYTKMIITNVNNYIAIKAKPTEKEDTDLTNVNIYENVLTSFVNNGIEYSIKTKGDFYTYDVSISDLHRNYSFLLASKAVINYFVHNINPIITIQKNRKLFDHLGLLRRNRKSEIYLIDPKTGETHSLRRKILRYIMVDFKNIDNLSKELSEKDVDIQGKIGYIVRINTNKKSLIHKTKNQCSLLIDDVLEEYKGNYDELKDIFIKYSSSKFIQEISDNIINSSKKVKSSTLFDLPY